MNTTKAQKYYVLFKNPVARVSSHIPYTTIRAAFKAGMAGLKESAAGWTSFRIITKPY